MLKKLPFYTSKIKKLKKKKKKKLTNLCGTNSIKSQNSQRWYLLGRTSGGFCDVDLHFCVVILHLPMLFTHIFFSTSSLTLPWTIARFLDPFCTFSPAHHRVIRDTFIFRPFHYLLTTSATVLSGHFLLTDDFYLTLLPNIFGTTCFYQGFCGSRQLFLKRCRASY